MEADDEIKGTKNSYDFGARIYDPRVGRFLSLDAFDHKFADISPYSFAGNSPIVAIDNNGDSIRVYTTSEDYVNKVSGAIQEKLGTGYTVTSKKIEVVNRTMGDTNGDGFPKETHNTYYTISITGPENSTNNTFELLDALQNSKDEDLNIVLDAKIMLRGEGYNYPLMQSIRLGKIVRYGHPNLNDPDKPAGKTSTEIAIGPTGQYLNLELSEYIAHGCPLELIDFILYLAPKNEKNETGIERVNQWKDAQYLVKAVDKEGDVHIYNNGGVRTETPRSVKKQRRKDRRRQKKEGNISSPSDKSSSSSSGGPSF